MNPNWVDTILYNAMHDHVDIECHVKYNVSTPNRCHVLEAWHHDQYHDIWLTFAKYNDSKNCL